MLDRIIQVKRAQIQQSKQDLPLESIINRLEQIDFTSSPSFLKALKKKMIWLSSVR